jgi:hypothetical protein
MTKLERISGQAGQDPGQGTQPGTTAQVRGRGLRDPWSRL